MSSSRTLLADPLAGVKSEELLWTWADVIPMGVVTLLGGRAGIGKSTFLAWLTAQLTTGNLDGDLKGRPVHVAFVAGEDDLGRVLKPRLEAAGADLNLITALSVRNKDSDGASWVSMPNIKSDLNELHTFLRDNETKLLIIDPLSATMEGDTNSEQVVRSQLGRLAHIAGEENISILAVKHWHKGAGESIDRISGSHGFTDIVRSVLQLVPDEETGQLILSSDKNNYGKSKPSFAYSLETVEVRVREGVSNLVGKARFLGETEVRVEDILRRESESNLGDANKKILDYLKSVQQGTPQEVADETGVSRETATRYLSRLVKNGHVERISQGQYRAVRTVSPVRMSERSHRTTGQTGHPARRCPVHDLPNPEGICGPCEAGILI